MALFYSRNSTWSFLWRIKQASNELAFSFFVNSTSHNHSTTLIEPLKGVFHPTEHSYAKKKKSKILDLALFISDRQIYPLLKLPIINMQYIKSLGKIIINTSKMNNSINLNNIFIEIYLKSLNTLIIIFNNNLTSNITIGTKNNHCILATLYHKR